GGSAEGQARRHPRGAEDGVAGAGGAGVMDVGTNAPVYAPTALPPSAVERTRHFWTTRELKLVEQLYPAGGLPACLAALPNRTAGAIYQKAGVLGLLRQGRKP